jgi:hypothetical protein
MPAPPDTNTDPRFLSIAQAVARFGTSPKTLQRRADAGLLTRHVKNTRTYYLLAELQELFALPPQPVADFESPKKKRKRRSRRV